MKMLPSLAIMGLTSLLGIAAFGFAEASDRNKEEIFVGKTTINANFEIESSKLALRKSGNADVRALAQQMIDGHRRMAQELKDVQDRTKIGDMISFQQLDDEHQKKLEDLGKSSKAHFDEDYIDAQIIEHDEAITLFEDYVSEGRNADLRRFAAGQLPALKKHEARVQAIEKTL